ncbi:MAG: arginine--tRNA ligase [Thermoplasmata archaeon]|nr:arginine--tRNA ligase [Thermoplasmata archaeon]
MTGEDGVPDDPLSLVKRDLGRLLSGVLADMGVESPAPVLEVPDEELGDLSLACFPFSPALRRSPAEIASEVARRVGGLLEAARGEAGGGEGMGPAGVTEAGRALALVGRVEAVGPYVNFFLDRAGFSSVLLDAIVSRGPVFWTVRPRGHIILEHTSANPTDRLHVGRARNPIIGDTLARAARLWGYEVETQYYVDDMGRQAVTLAYGQHLWESAGEKERERFLGPYQYASHLIEADGEKKKVLEGWMKALERREDVTVDGVPLHEYVGEMCRRVMDEKIVPALERAGIRVDRFVYESSFVYDGSVERVIESLKGLPEARQDDNGAWYIDMAPYGVRGRDTRFFFTRCDGTSLYATRDIAYHLWKMERSEEVVDVLGEDHRLEAKQIEVCLGLLGCERRPRVVFYSFVGLPEGRMSTRKGRVVYFDDLLDEAEERAYVEVDRRRPELPEERKREIARQVAVGAVRYNIVRVQPEKKMVFRWEDALNFEGESAPFVQYSHARALSILRKAGEELRPENASHTAVPGISGTELHPSEWGLVRRLALFPGVLEDVVSSMRPHLLASYGFSLASVFNQFYRDCPVLSAEGGVREMRMALVRASALVLETVLETLGIPAPEEM